jgi:hypothetical protein
MVLHSPFVKGDPLWMPFGDKRKEKEISFVVNGIKHPGQ